MMLFASVRLAAVVEDVVVVEDDESPPPSESGSGRTQLVGKKPLSPFRSRVPFHWSKKKRKGVDVKIE